MEKILTTVVIYNPDQTVFNNILTHINFSDELLIVDNSENTTTFPDSILINPKITIIENGTNLGIARALNIGAKIALEKGYKWMLTMDQDSSFESSAAAEYFTYFQNSSKETLGILSPSQLKNQIITDEPLIVMTSGNIINLQCYQMVGGFNDSLFIDEVDHDYCLKVLSNNFNIKQVGIKMNHTLGNYRVFSFLNKKLIISVHSPIRLYYIVRNNLYMFKTYGKIYPALIKDRRRMLLRVIFNNLFFDPKSLVSKLRNINKAIADFKQNRYGKYEG